MVDEDLKLPLGQIGQLDKILVYVAGAENYLINRLVFVTNLKQRRLLVLEPVFSNSTHLILK